MVMTTQAQFGVALHRQAAAEEQRVGVLLALGEQQEVVGRGAERQVRHGGRRERGMGRETLAGPGKVERQARIAHLHPHLPVEQQAAHVGGQVPGQREVERRHQQHRARVGGQARQHGPHGRGNHPRVRRRRGGESSHRVGSGAQAT
jgi:hypothetical protein